MQSDIFFGIAAFSAALAVAAGAFGAHGLEGKVEPRMLQVFETAARYHMVHALGLALVAVAGMARPNLSLNGPAWMLMAGTIVFSGSLYALVLTNTKWLGAITPVGGVLLIAAWIWAAVTLLRS